MRRRAHPVRAAWIALGVVLGASAWGATMVSDAHAQSERANESRAALERGRRLYADLDFDAAVDAFRRALASPGLTEAERLEALEYLGCVYVVLERNDSARSTFEEMLRLDPYRTLRESSGSPRIRDVVDRVRARLVPDAALDPRVELRVRVARRARTGERVHVRAEVRGPREIASASVVSRVGDGEYRTMAMRGTGRRFEADLPAVREADDVELYVVARDASGRVVARGGEPTAPRRIEIVAATRVPSGASGGARGREVEPSSPSVLSRWWFWTAIAAVVGGGVAIGLVVGGGDSAPDGTLPPGRVEIR